MTDFYCGTLNGQAPDIHPGAWVAPGAVVVGRVRIGRASSVWYGSVLRGDDDAIVVGEKCNIQDLCCLHPDPGVAAILEDRVSLGHKAMVHGAHIEEGSLVGIGAIVLTNARIGKGSLIAAGAVVTPGTHVPPRSLVAGVPGKVIREVSEADAATFADTPESYVEQARSHRAARWE